MATTLTPADKSDLLAELTAVPSATNIDAHNADKAKRKAVRDARRDKMLMCLDGDYAAKCEMEKPRYKFTVSASWLGMNSGRRTNFNGAETVVAKNAAEAWAKFCDRLQTWPSVENVKRTITKGEQVSISESLTEAAVTMPSVTLVAPPTRMQL